MEIDINEIIQECRVHLPASRVGHDKLPFYHGLKCCTLSTGKMPLLPPCLDPHQQHKQLTPWLNCPQQQISNLSLLTHLSLLNPFYDSLIHHCMAAVFQHNMIPILTTHHTLACDCLNLVLQRHDES